MSLLETGVVLNIEGKEEVALNRLWKEIYGDNEDPTLLNNFISEMRIQKQQTKPKPKNWYREAVIYCCYVDLFAQDFKGMTSKLGYLEKLGINTIWILPVLDSPMFDAGFDIRNYRNVRKELGTNDEYLEFIKAAHDHDIRIIMDIALNHTSIQHPWFENPETRYKYYIWHKDDKTLYQSCRIIFDGICESNWEKYDDQYFFHRFLASQPDLNYRNPEVLIAITKVFVYWLTQGIDGFRADAVPFLWKENNTECESLPNTHNILKFIRAATQYVSPNTLILAEACQPTQDVVNYFGSGHNQCQACYHFPLLPNMFFSFAREDSSFIDYIIKNTPQLPSDECQWFVFLRCHDELTLEMVDDDEMKKEMYQYYCRDEKWSFRKGGGVCARLLDLLQDVNRVQMAHSMILTILGTPILFYGDEYGKLNDEQYYEDFCKISKITTDHRYRNRGYMNWDVVENEIPKKDTVANKIYTDLTEKLNVRKGLGWIHDTACEIVQDTPKNIVAYKRHGNEQQTLLVVNNLSNKETVVTGIKFSSSFKNLLSTSFTINDNDQLVLPPYGHGWFLTN